MNEDGTPIVADVVVEDTPTENIPAADGGVTTTPDEVAKILNLPVAPVVEDDKDDDKVDDVVDDDKTDDDKVVDGVVDDDKKDDVVDDKVDDVVTDAPKFELVIEDLNGEKLTLKPDDDIEEVLKDFEPKNNGQIFKVLDDLHKLRAEKTAYDAEEATKSQEAEQAAVVAKISEGFTNEIKSLQGSKRLPVTTDGSISEREQAVWDFMKEENDKREKDGRPLLRSVEDTLDKLELKELKEAEVQKAKVEKELAKKRGGLVGGSSAPASGGAPVYQGGARTAAEASRQMGIR